MGSLPLTEEAGAGSLRRTLTFRDLIVYGLLFIAPMSAAELAAKPGEQGDAF